MGVPDAERSRWLRAVWLHDALRDAPEEELERWAPDAPGPRRAAARPGQRGARQGRGRDRSRRARRRALPLDRAGGVGHGRAGCSTAPTTWSRAAKYAREWRAELAAGFPRSRRWCSARWLAPRRLGTWSSSGRPLLEPTVRFWNSLVAASARVGLIAARGRRAWSPACALLVPPPPRARAGACLPHPFAGAADHGGGAERDQAAGVARAATRMLRRQGLDVVFFGNADARRLDPGHRAPGRSRPRAGRAPGARCGPGRGGAGHASAGGRERDLGLDFSPRAELRKSEVMERLSIPRRPPGEPQMPAERGGLCAFICVPLRLIPLRFICCFLLSSTSSFSADPDHHIHHVGSGESWAEQHAGRIERAIGVVRGEVAGGSRPAAVIALQVAPSTMAPAASVGPSRPSVPAANSAMPAGARASARAAASASSWQRPPSPGGASPSVTVVSPPQIRQRALRDGPARIILQQCSGYTRSGRRRLPGERRLFHHRNEAQLCRPPGRSFEGQAVTRDQLERHARERRVTRLRRFGCWSPSEASRTCRRAGSGIRSQRPDRSSRSRTSPRGGGIGHAGAGADRGEVVADDVGDDVDADRRRREGEREPAAAPAGEPLADAVHGGDVEARAEQQGVELGQLGRRDAVDRRAEQAGACRPRGGPTPRRPSRLARPPRRARSPRPGTRRRAPGGRRGRAGSRGGAPSPRPGGTIRPPGGSAPRRPRVSTAAWAMGSAALPSAMIQGAAAAGQRGEPRGRVPGRDSPRPWRRRKVAQERRRARGQARLRGL